MNDTSGFKEVWPSVFRSPLFRFLQGQRHRVGTGTWRLLHTHNLMGLSTDIITKREMIPDTFFMDTWGPLESDIPRRREITW